MTDIKEWMKSFSAALEEAFGDRLFFIGLQGSYGRGEATEDSDIDVVVILDCLTADDIDTYDKVKDGFPEKESVCGFISGRQELVNWNPADLFQFYYDTRPVKGSIDELRELIDLQTVDRAIKTGVCNIYHGCVHNMLYDKSTKILKELYKSATFVIRAVSFADTGRYTSELSSLVESARPEDKSVIRTFLQLKRGGEADLEQMSRELFIWAQNLING